jgi:HSP20 family protein
MTWLSHLDGTCVRAVSLPANGDVELQRGRLKLVLVAGRQSAGHSKHTTDFKEAKRPRGGVGNRPATSGFKPASEIVKDGDDAVVRVELPGVDVEKDVNVEVDKGRLVIHGEHRDEHADEQEGRTLREIRYGSFRRSFQLPAHVTGEAIAASYDAGVPTVRVTGAYAGSQAQKIAITS